MIDFPPDFEDWHRGKQDAWVRATKGATMPPKPGWYPNGQNEPGAFYEPPGAFVGADKPPAIVERMSNIEMKAISWIWNGWLAQGKFHILAGATGAGKTTVALSLSSILSAGERWPDGTRAEAGNSLLWTSEDGIEDTIKPRLVRMGADLERAFIIRGCPGPDGKRRPFCPATDMENLVSAAKLIDGGVKLLVLDPVSSAISSKANSHNNAETRNSLQPVIDFAEAANCAVVGISHFTKGTSGRDPTERVTGSLAFAALARVVMVAAEQNDPDADGPPRSLMRSKSNIGERDGGFGFDLDTGPISFDHPDIVATRILWLDAIEGTAKEMLNAAESDVDEVKRQTKVEAAKRFLEAMLAKEEMPQREVEAAASLEGISVMTLRRAACFVSKRQKNRLWLWSIT